MSTICPECNQNAIEPPARFTPNSRLYRMCRSCALKQRNSLNYKQGKRKLYGLQRTEFMALVLNHEFRCALCRAAFETETHIHIDHCHSTGRVRGLLCKGCNTALGKLGDDVAGLQKALDYIKGDNPYFNLTAPTL